MTNLDHTRNPGITERTDDIISIREKINLIFTECILDIRAPVKGRHDNANIPSRVSSDNINDYPSLGTYSVRNFSCAKMIPTRV